MESPLPAHKRAEILVRVAGRARQAGRRGRAADLRRGGQAAEGGSRRGRAGDVDLHDGRRRGAHARGRDGADGRVAGGRGQARVHACAARSVSSARSRRSTSRSTSSPTRSRRRSPRAAPSSSSPPRRRRCRRCSSPSSSTRPGCPPGWLNVVVGPSSEIGDVLVEDERVKLITFTGSGAVGWEHPRARAEEEGRPRARERDAGDRRGRRGRRGRGDPLRRERVLLRRPELHLGAAHLRPRATSTTTSRRASCRRWRRSMSATPPTRRPMSGR